MQKLSVKLKNTPTDTPLVRCSVSSGVNKVKRPRCQDKVLTDNNLEVDLALITARQNLRVSVTVLSMRGNPLMPCSFRRAKKLVREGKAKLVGSHPFRIQLLSSTGETTQKCRLGIDVGYKHNGFSVVNEKKELVCGTLELDDKTSERLETRKMYRKNRRNKLWYREPRFNNRKIEEGWLPPSVSRRYQTILRFINKLCSWYPIEKIVIETASFDIQKINNPDIEGKDYQQGDLCGYQNVRSFLFAREQGKCQYCGKEFTKNDSSHIHHIISRSNGGTDKPNNLALLHEKCHKTLHKKKNFSKLKKNKQYKAETWMNIIRNRFQKDLPDIEVTFGYITNIVRNSLGLDKTHYNDAFVIAGGSNQFRVQPITITQKHKNNRCLQTNRKGYKPSIRRCRYDLQPGDLVKIKGSNKNYSVKGVHHYGDYVYVWDKNKLLDLNTKKVTRCFHQKTLMY